MTRIVEVAGIPAVQAERTDATELKQRAKLVQPTAYIDTAALSQGEMMLLLKAQRAKMYAEFYPETKEYRQEYERMMDALYNGLHRAPGLSYLPERLQTKPASGYLTWEDKARNPNTGFDTLFEGGNAVSGIGVITQLDCDNLFKTMTQTQWNQGGYNAYGSIANYWEYVALMGDKRAACQLENRWRKGLNDFWEDSGHVLIYEWLSSSIFGQLPEAAVQKKTRQIDFLDSIAAASKINRANLKFWTENGIIANNIAAGLGPIGAVSFIEGLKENADVKINGFGAALLKVAVGTLTHTFKQFGLFIGVVKGDLSLKQAVEQHVQNVENWFKTYSEDVKVLASQTDFAEDFNNLPPDDQPPGTPGGGGLGLSKEAMIGLGLAGVGLLLYNK